MSDFNPNNILNDNLNRFIRKYYLRELVKGIVLFVLLSFFYVLITALIENLFWLPKQGRRLLFYAQWLVLGIFFIFFIAFPLLKLLGFLNPITKDQAAKMIGNYFPGIKDKLLNTLQLQRQNQHSELVMASIAQKVDNFKIFDFGAAVNFKRIYKYLPLLLVPVFIFLVLRLFHYDTSLKKSYERVLSYQQNYTPPLPYRFDILDSLQTVAGQDYKLHIKLSGDALPQQLFINLNNKQFLLQKQNDSIYIFDFPVVTKPITFGLTDGKHHLGDYTLSVIQPPVILQTQIKVIYPSYLHRKPAIFNQNTNLTVPQSSRIIWQLHTQNTDSIQFGINRQFKSYKVDNQIFNIDMIAHNSFSYQIIPTNKYLSDFQSIDYDVKVIKDEFPKINVIQKRDTIQRQNYYQITGSDDYGLSSLYLVYTDQQNHKTSKFKIPFSSSDLLQTIFVFPGNISIEKGHQYAYYFVLRDNDSYHGYKASKSQTFFYNSLSDKQLEQQNLKQQKQNLANFEAVKNKMAQQKKQLDNLSEKITSQKQLDWQTQKQLQNILQQSQQQEQFFKERLNKFKDLLNKLPEKSQSETKKDLEKRLADLAQMKKKQKLLDELKKLADKLKKEDLLEKLKDLKNYSEHQEKSLERILELTKKYYLQQKMHKMSEQLNHLAQKQDSLSHSIKDTAKAQDSLNKAFDKLKKQTDSLAQLNKSLKKTMNMPDMDTDMKDIKQDMNRAKNQLQQQQSQSANQSQKKAANKMKQLSKSMQMAMMSGGGEQNEEDVKTLQAILKSLINFSFKEEGFLTDLYTDNSHKYLSKQLIGQNHLKTYFKQINDSLYTLALRNPKISQMVLDEAFEIKNSLEKSLSYLSENQLYKTQSAAQYILKSSNTLADFLSNALDNMKNAASATGQGQGKKGKGESFSLPDIIKKQGQALSKAKQGMKKKQGKGQKGGKQQDSKNGKQNGGKEGDARRQYELYKQQQQIKEDLNQLGDKFSDQAQKKRIADLAKQMDELSKRILKEGITESIIQKMINLQHELLKLKNATFNQHEDNKRESRTNFMQFNGIDSLFLRENFKILPENESLKRNQIPVNQKVKQKIIQYLN